MKKEDLDSLSTPELVERFADICVEQDRNSHRVALANKLFRQAGHVENVLRRRGRDARLALVILYDHPNPFVRLQAATYTLGVNPIEARRVIEEVSESTPIRVAADARGRLRCLDEGIFKPD